MEEIQDNIIELTIRVNGKDFTRKMSFDEPKHFPEVWKIMITEGSDRIFQDIIESTKKK